MNFIDLDELSKRESERVEWKENVADIEDVVKTAVAFANDYSNLGGGYIVCGAAETTDGFGFQKVELKGLTSSRLKEIEGKVVTMLRERVSPPIVPIIEEIPVSDENRVIVFVIVASEKAHSFRSARTKETVYYIRTGRQTREARNGLMMDLFRMKGVQPAWDKQINRSSAPNDLDLIILRNYLQEMRLWDEKKSVDDYLSTKSSISAYIPPFLGAGGIDNLARPRNFSLLIFSKEPVKYFNGAFAYFSVYKGTDRSEPFGIRHEISGDIVQQARKLIDLLRLEAPTFFEKTSPEPNRVKYPMRALQEAVVNCIVHRDYEVEQPVRITVFSDRIEFYSPGRLPRQIDREAFLAGRAAPFWRNQTLAYFFNKLQLAQGEGQGIPTILRTLSDAGCPAPKFEFGEESVTTTIYPVSPPRRINV